MKPLERPRSYEELLQLGKGEPPYLIEGGLLVPKGKVVVYGREGIGKTWLASQTSQDLAAGKPWLSIFRVARPLGVLHVDLEMSAEMFAHRARRQSRQYANPHLETLKANLNWWHVGGLNLVSGTDKKSLTDAIRSTGAVVLVLDPLLMAVQGDISDYKVSVPFMHSVDQIIEDTGAAFVFVSHETKRQRDKLGRDMRQGSDKMLGAGLKNWFDGIYLVERVKEPANGLRLTFEKLRHGPPLKPIVLAWNPQTGLYSKDGVSPNELATPVLELSEAEEVVLKWTEKEIARKHLIATCQAELSYSERQVERVIARLQKRGYLDRRRGQHQVFYKRVA